MTTEVKCSQCGCQAVLNYDPESSSESLEMLIRTFSCGKCSGLDISGNYPIQTSNQKPPKFIIFPNGTMIATNSIASIELRTNEEYLEGPKLAIWYGYHEMEHHYVEFKSDKALVEYAAELGRLLNG